MGDKMSNDKGVSPHTVEYLRKQGTRKFAMKLSKKNAARQSAISRALASGKGLGGLLVGIATAVVGGCSERSPSTVMGDYPAPQQLNTERETREASVMGKMILKDDKSQNCTTNAVNEFESMAEGGGILK